MTDISNVARLSEPLKFAYWVPNVSGGLVVSTIEQRTGWDFEYNKKLARIAENSGFEYALTQTRYAASYGADKQHEATSFSLALLAATERLKVISAVHPGMWHPGVLAKYIITADHISNGRAAVNIVSGWLKDEFTNFGLEWLEHDERYVRTEEFIKVLRGLWTEQDYSQSGKYYNITDFTLNPAPVDVPGRAHPEIFFGGNSTAAQATAGRVADWYFSNGKDLEGFKENIAGVVAASGAAGRGPEGAAPLPQVWPERLRDRPGFREGSPRHPPRDRREGAQARRRGVPRRRPGSRGVHQGRQGHVGRLELRGPGPVQRRLQDAADRHPGADRRADRGVQEDRREPVPDRLPALPGGSRRVRPGHPADRPRTRGGSGPEERHRTGPVPDPGGKRRRWLP